MAMPALVIPRAIRGQPLPLVQGRASGVPNVRHHTLETIAVLLDGSPQAAAALAPARALAARLDATLELYWLAPTALRTAQASTPEAGTNRLRLHASDLEPRYLDGGGGRPVAGLQRGCEPAGSLDHGAFAGRMQTAGPAASDHAPDLDAAVEVARAQGLRVRGRRLAVPACGATSAAVRRALSEIEPGLLVVAGRETCCRAADGFGALAGRLAPALLAEPRLPLLFVPPHYGFRTGDGALQWIGWEQVVLDAVHSGRPLAPLPVMVALDGSAAAEHTLPLAAALARSAGARLSLVRVVPPEPAGGTTPRSELAAAGAALGYLRQIAARLQAAGLPPAALRTAVSLGNVAEQLLLQATRERAAILMLARGRARSPRLACRRGLVLRLLQRAPLPILIAPAEASL